MAFLLIIYTADYQVDKTFLKIIQSKSDFFVCFMFLFSYFCKSFYIV